MLEKLNKFLEAQGYDLVNDSYEVVIDYHCKLVFVGFLWHTDNEFSGRIYAKYRWEEIENWLKENNNEI